MQQAHLSKIAAIKPYLNVLKRISIEETQGGFNCIPMKRDDIEYVQDSAEQLLYRDAYPSGQDLRSPCFVEAEEVEVKKKVFAPPLPPAPPVRACVVTPTAADGNCFFDSTSIAINRAQSIQDLRQVVADATTEDVLAQYKLDGRLQREFNVRGMRLADLKRVIMTKQWWAEEFAIFTVAQHLNVLFYLVDAAPQSEERIKVQPYDAEYEFEFVIPLWYSGNHYENIDCNGSKMFERGNLPLSIQHGITFDVRRPVRYIRKPAEIYIVVARKWSDVRKSNALPTLLTVDILNETRYMEIMQTKSIVLQEAARNRHVRRVSPTDIEAI
jgi:hypothetical protein